MVGRRDELADDADDAVASGWGVALGRDGLGPSAGTGRAVGVHGCVERGDVTARLCDVGGGNQTVAKGGARGRIGALKLAAESRVIQTGDETARLRNIGGGEKAVTVRPRGHVAFETDAGGGVLRWIPEAAGEVIESAAAHAAVGEALPDSAGQLVIDAGGSAAAAGQDRLGDDVVAAGLRGQTVGRGPDEQRD